MDTLQSAFLPLGAFWVAFQAIQGSTSFVNGMRETIVTGQLNGVSLTIRHRHAIRFDWLLSMCSTVFALFLFSGVIFWLALHTQAPLNVSPAMIAVGVSTFLGGLLFTICGISDYRLIQFTLRDATLKSKSRNT